MGSACASYGEPGGGVAGGEGGAVGADDSGEAELVEDMGHDAGEGSAA